MSPRFLNFIPFILEWETEFNRDGSVKTEHDPDDPGGTTRFGIDQRSHPQVNIATLAKEQAMQIYWTDYWLRCKGEQLPKNVGEVCMNISVNAGYGRAAKWLQQAVGVVADGVIGPKTLEAASAINAATLTEALLDRTEEHYRSIARGRLVKYLNGWLNRNNSLREWVKRQ